MFQTHPLGRLFGVELRLHGTVLLLAAVLGGMALLSGGLGEAIGTVLLLAAVLGSVTLHELGHIAAARLFGIGTTGVTLFPFGGVAQLTREARTPTEEVVVAVAGPAVNVLLAALAALPLVLFGWIEPLGTFLWVNVALAVFNLVPAYPMDGGRVFRGALWPWLGHFQATWWAARAGQAFAVAFALLGLVANPMLILIAAFVFLQASAELSRLRLRAAAGAVPQPGAAWGFGHFHGPQAHDDVRPYWGPGGAPRPAGWPQQAGPFAGRPGRFVAIRTPWGTVLRWDDGR